MPASIVTVVRSAFTVSSSGIRSSETSSAEWADIVETVPGAERMNLRRPRHDPLQIINRGWFMQHRRSKRMPPAPVRPNPHPRLLILIFLTVRSIIEPRRPETITSIREINQYLLSARDGSNVFRANADWTSEQRLIAESENDD